MQGKVIAFNKQTGSATIRGRDGLSYTTSNIEVVGEGKHLWAGAQVDFLARRDSARKVVVLDHQSWFDALTIKLPYAA
jgi:hypothetical protein